MKPRFTILTCLGLLLAGSTAFAETAVTPPAGYVQLNVRGATDNLLAVTLLPRPALLVRVSAVSAGSLTLVAVNSPADGTYAPSSSAAYTLQFMTGALEGLTYKVTGNTGGVFTLDTLGDDLTAHPLGVISANATTGDLVHVRACWTVGDIFGGTAGSLVLAPVPDLIGAVYSSGDLVLLPDNAGAGLDKKPAMELGFVTGQGWRRRGGTSNDATAQPLLPGVPLAVRRQDSASVGVWVVGYAPQERGVLRLPAVAADAELDFSVAPLHPVARTVSNLQLGAALIASPDVLNYGDGILDYTGTRRGFAPPPAHRLYFTSTGWREGDAPADTHVLASDAGYILRRRGAHPVSYWLQTLPYSR